MISSARAIMLKSDAFLGLKPKAGWISSNKQSSQLIVVLCEWLVSSLARFVESYLPAYMCLRHALKKEMLILIFSL